MIQRIRCCIPGCKKEKTVRKPLSDWICEPHWKFVPYKLRNRVESARSLMRKAQAEKNSALIGSASVELRKSWGAAIMEAKLKAADKAAAR